MLYEGIHDCPEHINCSEVVQNGGRVKAGAVSKTELEGDEEIRVSIRSTMYPSVEVFTLRNIKPADYQIILVAIPRNKVSK
jgi:hypothetical protein